ncbi:MAG: BON domain-containing protein [Acidobacteriota bacterium]|nr:BON domain-containing protein [Acidobacteriota bacterium]
MKKIFATAILGLVIAVMPVAANPINETEGPEKTVKKIRKELVTLPFYGVFDNLAFKYEDGKVILYGQVSRPTLKSDAKRVVERVAGVEEVENKIEVLPLSNFDDQIRLATYRAIYRQPGLDRLSFQAVPPIHIIVKNGNVTLEGVVATKGDATRAFIAANGVSNVFSVTNNLRMEKD